MDFFEATYHLDVAADRAEALAEAVHLEQTIETPRTVGLRYPFVRAHMMGSRSAPVPDPEGGFRVTLSLPVRTAAADPAQFLNVLFGNSSMHAAVRLDDFTLPEALASLFRGPRFGIEGLRARLGVHGRPLTASALKPVGLSVEETAELCRTLAEGGVDLIKDDHYLADHPFCPFEARVRACLDAVAEGAARGGTQSVYVPNLSGTPETILRQYDFAREAGVEAVMIAPMLVGLPFFHELTHRRLDVPVLAHPSFTGAARMRPAVLPGKLFRLFGADAVIFANYGGRFSFPRDVCLDVAEALRRPWPPFPPAFPVPAGGMQVERAAELVETFGTDAILLIGGSLLEAGDALLERTRAFTEGIARAALSTPLQP
jgi:ribulose-bisphosphate carboxylase large chain